MDAVNVVARRGTFISALYAALREAEESFDVDYNGASRIQTAFRGSRVRARLAEYQ